MNLVNKESLPRFALVPLAMMVVFFSACVLMKLVVMLQLFAIIRPGL
jgi:hypothetical protein